MQKKIREMRKNNVIEFGKMIFLQQSYMLKCIKIQRDTILIATFFIRLFCHPYLRAWGQHLYHSDLISQN